MFEELNQTAEQPPQKTIGLGNKPPEHVAVASGYINMGPGTVKLLVDNIQKGDILSIARVAGVQAAKQASLLIPLCHSNGLSHVRADFEVDLDVSRLKATVATSSTTALAEMEALTGVSVALLTIYDMLKTVDKKMTVTQVQMVSTSRAESNDFAVDSSFENISF